MVSRNEAYRSTRWGTARGLVRGTALEALAALGWLASPGGAAAQGAGGTIDLTLERMVQLALSNSYDVRFLNMDVEETRQRLRAERARLRSSVELEVSAPDFQSISETQYNSTLGRNQIIRENSRRWEAELSIRQPVILFGYPTNGYLSLNNRVYRYAQRDEDGERDLTYYNRYFVEYTQPLFQPNELRNSLAQAELDLESAEVDFTEDVLEIVQETSEDYFQLFENRYREEINAGFVANLERGLEVAQGLASADPSRAIDSDQISVELANAREQLQQSLSQFRLQAAQLRTQLALAPSDVISVDPVIELRPIEVDVQRATAFAMELAPTLRELDIEYRAGEIELDETQGEDGFRVDVSLSYGREMQDPAFSEMWDEPSNSYTLDVNAFVPIWDWGERDARVQASQIELTQTELQIEQARAEIVSDVQNEVRNIEELQQRALSMQGNLALATNLSTQSLERYRDGSITVVDLLQSFRRQVDTAGNFIDAYLGWRQALLSLQELTYYDFEFDAPVLERFGIDPSAGAGVTP